MRNARRSSRRVSRVKNHATWFRYSLGRRMGKHSLLPLAIAFVALLMIVQIFYPSSRLLPFARIDGRIFSASEKTYAARELDAAYSKSSVAIFMGSMKQAVTSPKLADADMRVDNAARLDAVDYPWYLRIIPTSLFWAGLRGAPTPELIFGKKFDTFIKDRVMPACRQAPVDATLRVEGDALKVVKAQPGGQCEFDDVIARIKTVTPSIQQQAKVSVARKEIAPAIGDAAAKKRAEELSARLGKGITMKVGDEPTKIDTGVLYSWLDFSPRDGTIAATVNGDRAGKWLGEKVAEKVTVKPGVSRITTVDFTEVSRSNGNEGRALDVGATVQSVQAVVDGVAKESSAVTKSVPPTEQYTRSYSSSDAGLSALLSNFAHDHPGTYGATLIELDGRKRRASYNGDQQFVTASTYKLFVAYSLLKQIDSGKRDWGSNADCFNKMISQSDNACAESFLNSLGLKTVTDDIQAIGLGNSTFMKSGGPFTTANDQALLLGMIATGQNFSAANQQRLIAAMKANVFRQGIPAGVNGTVADKVGFMNGLLHDSAIVYGPHGTYVLSIMTDGSSWATIADLAKQIDTLRAR